MSDLFSVKGKTALVTGGSSGIGYLIAKGLVEHGVTTYIVSRNLENCRAVAAELNTLGEESGANCYAMSADLSSICAISQLVAAMKEREEALDILVNNAGAMYEAPLAEFTEQGWDEVLDLNLKSVFFLSQQLMPLLKARACEDSHSAIVNIGSVGGLRVGPKENYSYQAAKAGLHHLTGSLAKNIAAEHVTVNAIAPGFFLSKITAIPDEMMPAILDAVPRRRIGKATDVVGAVIYLASQAGSFVTGAVLPVAGGMTL